MNIEHLQSAHKARPFPPFTIHMNDGPSLHVPHPEFLCHSPTGCTVIVLQRDESFSIIDLKLVTRLEVSDSDEP